MALFEHLKKKQTTMERSFKKVDTLIIGKTLFCFELFYKLKKNKSDGQVLLIVPTPVESRDLEFVGPHLIRGKENLRLAAELFPHLKDRSALSVATYFKDLTFRSFDGRGKSEPCKFSEEFYTREALPVVSDEVFTFFSDSQFLAELTSQPVVGDILSLKYLEDRWLVVLKSGLEIEAATLFWGDSGAVFSELAKNESAIPSELFSIVEKSRSMHALVVAMKFHSLPTSFTETTFLPLSYTHELGHFIGDKVIKSNETWVEWLHIFDPMENSDEEISRKIGMLRRQVEKAFERPTILDEAIYIYSDLVPSQVSSSYDVQIFKNFNNKFFILGINTPLSEEVIALYSLNKEMLPTGFIQGMLSLKSIYHQCSIS